VIILNVINVQTYLTLSLPRKNNLILNSATVTYARDAFSTAVTELRDAPE